MKVILYMAMSLNGFISDENGGTNFVSETEWQIFRKMTDETGNIIIGRKTYEIMVQNREFQKLGDLRVLIISNNSDLKTISDNCTVVNFPEEALKVLGKEGFNKALVVGGGMINSLFMKENLVDEVYVDIEPVIFGKGIKIFSENDFDKKLELIESKKLSDNEIQLHYKVVK